MRKSFGVDDWLMVFAQVSSILIITISTDWDVT